MNMITGTARTQEQLKPSQEWDAKIKPESFPGHRPPSTEYRALANNYDELIQLLNEDWFDVYLYCFELTEAESLVANQKAQENKVKLVKSVRQNQTADSLGELLDLITEKGRDDNIYVVQLGFKLEDELSAKEIENGIALWNQRNVFCG